MAPTRARACTGSLSVGWTCSVYQRVESPNRSAWGAHVCEEAGKGQAFVFCEYPYEARHGCEDVEETDEEEHADERDERVGGGLGARRVVHDVDDGEGCAFGDGVQGPEEEEEHGDEGQQEDGVDDAGEDDGSRDSGVDFLDLVACGSSALLQFLVVVSCDVLM